MSKYLKLFSTDNDRVTYEGGNDYIEPYVSYVEGDNTVHYNKPPYSGFCKLTLNDGSTVELEGSGELTTFMLYLYESTLVSAEIGTLCTSIGDGAFMSFDGLTSITISDSVTSIGDSAFYHCSGLTSITIPDSVTSIGYGVFIGCSALTSITIPNSVTSIGNSAFEECGGLTSITVESGNTVYDSRDSCNAIIETATNKLIRGCINTVIPNTVTSISSSAFSACRTLKSITIPSSVTSIGNSAFYNCSGLTSITIPSSVTSIGDRAFSGCSVLTSITIGNSVTSIGSSAFQSCYNLKSVTSLATKAPTIQSSTFQNVGTKGTLTVPSGNTGYGVWMGTGDYYLGKYKWVKVEQ